MPNNVIASILEQMAGVLVYLANMMRTGTNTLHQKALSFIGTDASPSDAAPDELGCAESVSEIIKDVWSDMPIITGTWTLWDFFERSNKFTPVKVPQAGDIVISPTGTGNGKIVGHTGIVGENQSIMSNDSYTGTWESNYTIGTWNERYNGKGGLPVLFYRLV